jgi:hypothetical protein
MLLYILLAHWERPLCGMGEWMAKLLISVSIAWFVFSFFIIITRLVTRHMSVVFNYESQARTDRCVCEVTDRLSHEQATTIFFACHGQNWAR